MSGAPEVIRIFGTNPPLVHPGPPESERRCIAPTRVRPFGIDVAAGENVEAAILRGFERAGCDSGWVRMDGLRCDPIRFIMPAASPTPDRLAWYSETHAPGGVAGIVEGYMSVGRSGARGATHCHGVWRLADGSEIVGHLLSDACRAAAPAVLSATGFVDASFERRADPETRFDLFVASGKASPGEASPATRPGAVAMTLRPNESLAGACRAACERFDIASAKIVGLGSLNGATFLDGARMPAPINEFLIRLGGIEADGADLFDLVAVDVDGTRFSGPVDLDRVTISITAEVVILPDAEPEGIT